jgi:hypothetical protein
MRLRRFYRIVNPRIESCNVGYFFNDRDQPNDPIGYAAKSLGYNYTRVRQLVRGKLPMKVLEEYNETCDVDPVGAKDRITAVIRDYIGRDMRAFLVRKGVDAVVLGLAVFQWEELVKGGMGKKQAWKESLEFGEWIERGDGICKPHNTADCQTCWPNSQETKPWSTKSVESSTI